MREEHATSLFTYCTQVLHFSEHAAYHRIETARAARYFPIILELVADGSVTTTTVALLRPYLTPDNHAELLADARHKTKREVERQIACFAPKPDAEAMIRRLPTRAAMQSGSGERARVADARELSVSLLRTGCRESRTALLGAQQLRKRTIIWGLALVGRWPERQFRRRPWRCPPTRHVPSTAPSGSARWREVRAMPFLLPERPQRLRRPHVEAAVGNGRRGVGVFFEIVDDKRRQIA